MASLLIISLITSTTFAHIHKYVSSPNQYNIRSDAKAYCESIGSQLATILSVTDNHDARNVCNNNNGCWIGLLGLDCTTSDHTCDIYSWDGPSFLPSSYSPYGFESFHLGVARTPRNNYIQNAWVSADGPWHPTIFRIVDGASCVYIDNTNTPSNAIWKINTCVGTAKRTALCDRPVPPALILYGEMVTTRDATVWQQMPVPSSVFELPISNNINRCWYANEPGDVFDTWAASKVLQGCWAIKTTNDNTARNSLGRFVSTENLKDCQVQVNMDPWSAQTGACLLEYTIDGIDWNTYQSFTSSDADTFYINLPESTNDNAQFGVRITLDENIDNDAECYFNHFYLRCFNIGYE